MKQYDTHKVIKIVILSILQLCYCFNKTLPASVCGNTTNTSHKTRQQPPEAVATQWPPFLAGENPNKFFAD